MDNKFFLSFVFLFLGGILLISTAFSLSSQSNRLLTASLYTPPQCPFHLGLTPNQVKTNSELSLKQEAILLKLFFTQAVLDSRGVAICKETDSLNTCLARFQNLCYQQGKCEEQYDGSKDATLTPELQAYLCTIWSQRYTKIFASWTKVTSLFAQKNTSIPSWLTTSKQSFITYQQQIQQQQVANQINEPVKQVINPEDRIIKEKPVYVGSFELGEQIDLTNPELKNNLVVLNPTRLIDNNLLTNSGGVKDRSIFTMSKPGVSIFKNKDGSYNGNWIVMDAPSGLISIKILDKNGKVIYSDQVFSADQISVVFKDFTLDKDAIDPNQEYTFVISGGNEVFGQKSGTYKFSGESLVKGGSIIDGIITTQYNPKNSYLYYINGAVSPDGKTLSLDLQIGKAAGPTIANDIKALVIKNTKTGEVKTITGDELLKALGGGKFNISLDLSDSTDFVVELINSSGKTIEAYNGKITEGGLLQLSQTIKGASGYGSVYDPIVTYATHGYPQGYSISIHARAAGASGAQVIDAATGQPIAEYKSGDFYISGSQNKYKQGYTYYIIYYDQNGNIAKTQKFIVTDKSGHLEIQDINEPPSFSKTCGGQYMMKFGGQIEKITLNGKSYTIEEAKQLGIFNPDVLNLGQLVLNRDISASLQNIIVTYIDSLGVQQSATFKVEGGTITMTEFSNTLAQLIPPLDEKVGNPVELKNGTVFTYYKNDQLGKYYVKVDNYQGLKIESISFGYADYDNDPLYKQKIIEQFNGTGILPAGAQITFQGKDGGSVTINTASQGGSVGKYGPIYVRGDTTITKEEEKIAVNKGIITIPLAKINEENEELEGNEYYQDPIVQALINEVKNDSYCKTHTCGFSQGAYTVTINPFTGKITVEVDEAAKAAADEAIKKAAEEAAAKKAEQKIKNRENYEKALDNMAGMTEELKNKLMNEYDAKNPPENPPPVGGGGGGGGKIYYAE